METYKIKVMCNNCENIQDLDIEKGKKISDAECPNCGCKELVKSFEEENGSQAFPPEEW